MALYFRHGSFPWDAITHRLASLAAIPARPRPPRPSTLPQTEEKNYKSGWRLFNVLANGVDLFGGTPVDVFNASGHINTYIHGVGWQADSTTLTLTVRGGRRRVVAQEGRLGCVAHESCVGHINTYMHGTAWGGSTTLTLTVTEGAEGCRLGCFAHESCVDHANACLHGVGWQALRLGGRTRTFAAASGSTGFLD